MQLLHAHVLRGVVSEETVVLCRWGSSRQKFGFINRVDNKHLMTGPKGNSDCGFPETLNVPEAKPRETLRSRGNKTHCFPRGQSLSVLLYLPTQNRTIHR